MTQPEVWEVYQALAKKRKRVWDLVVSDHYHGTGLVAIK